MKANCYKDDAVEAVSIPKYFIRLAHNVIVGGPYETSAGQDDGSRCGSAVGRGARFLRPRIFILQRGDIHIRKAQALHQEDEA